MSKSENLKRAARAESALEVYQGADVWDESRYADLICDSLHAAESEGVGLLDTLHSALSNYLEESHTEMDLPTNASELFVACEAIRSIRNRRGTKGA